MYRRPGYNRPVQHGTVRVDVIIGDRIGDALGQGGSASKINAVRRIKRPGPSSVHREGTVLRINSLTDRTSRGCPIIIIIVAVSYPHLTLPTKRIVYISVRYVS